MIDEVKLIEHLTSSIETSKAELAELRNDQFNSGARGRISGSIMNAEGTIQAIRQGNYDVSPQESNFERIMGELSHGRNEQAISVIEHLSIREARSVLSDAVVQIKKAEEKKHLAITVKELVKSVLLSE